MGADGCSVVDLFFVASSQDLNKEGEMTRVNFPRFDSPVILTPSATSETLPKRKRKN